MRLSLALLTSVVVYALSSAAAHADTFAFSFGTPADTFSGSGLLTATLQTPGQYLITGITGTTETGNGAGRPITALLPVDGFDGNDNLLLDTAAGMKFDVFGLSYVLKNGAMINLSTDIDGDIELLERANGKDIYERVPYSVTSTPEPGSFVLLGTGVLAAAGVVRRRMPA